MARKFKRRVRRIRQKTKVGKDRISQFSDDVICHILSFLSIQDAVRTTILSKRWNNVWMISIPNVDLDHLEIGDKFSEFVDGVLSLHSSSNIRKLRIYDIDPAGFPNAMKNYDFLSCNSRWISKAMMHNIVELDLQILLGFTPKIQDIEIPQSLFTSKTLVSLKVNSDCISLAPPPLLASEACFPSLKSLHYQLHRCDAASMLRLLVSKCPVLEDLTVDRFLFEFVKKDRYIIDIPAPKLKTFRIEADGSNDDEMKEYMQYNIFVDAENLENFVVWDKICTAKYYFSNDAKSMVKATVHYIHDFYDLRAYKSGDVERAPSLLQQVSGVEYLSLFSPKFPACSLPWFNNLKHLEVGVFSCTHWEYVMQLLNMSPNLEALVLDIGFRRWGKLDYEPFRQPKDVPECLSSKLKTISFVNFQCCYNDFDVLKYFLRHGKALKRLHISASEIKSRYLRMTMAKLKNKAFSFWKCSNACEIQIRVVDYNLRLKCSCGYQDMDVEYSFFVDE